MPLTIQHSKTAQMERKRAQSRAAYLRNRDAVNSRSKSRQQQLRAEDPEGVRRESRKRHAENRDRINALKRARRARLKATGTPEKQYRNPVRDREYYEANRDAWRANYRRWSAANPDKEAARAARRRASIQRATPKWADLGEINRIYQEALRLSVETGIPHQVDHRIPLNGKTVSGLHWHENLQVITRTANLEKGNRLCQ